MLNTLAFSKDLLQQLWRFLARTVPVRSASSFLTSHIAAGCVVEDAPCFRPHVPIQVSAEFPLADTGPGAGRGVWISPTLTGGVTSLRPESVAAFGLFASAYDHLLFILDDDECDPLCALS